MADERETLVRNMVAAGEPDEVIDKALSHYDDATHPIASALGGFVGGVPGGLWGAVSGPFDVAKRVITDTVNAAKGDPSFTQSKEFLDSLSGLKDKWEKASASERGEMVGNLVGGFAGGAAEGAIVGKPNLAIKPSIRMVGKGLEYAGDHPFAARMSGGAMLATGLYLGNPEMMVGGTAAMAAPALLTKAGRSLRELGGEDLSEKMPSSATQNFDLKGNRVAPAKPVPGPPAIPSTSRSSGYRIGYGSGQPPTPVAADRLPSGSRTLDVGDISGLTPSLATAPAPAGGFRIASPGSPTGPAPYRPAAKAAVRAEEADTALAGKTAANAERLAEIERRKAGTTAQPPTVSESLSAQTPDGGRASSSIRYTRPKPGVGDGADGATDDLASQVFDVHGQKVRPGTPAHTKIMEAMRRQQTPAVDAAGRDLGTTVPPVAAKPVSGPQGVPAAAAGADASDRAAVASTANPRRTEGTVRQAPPKVTPPADGASNADIIALRTEHGAEEAGTKLASDPRFAGMTKIERTNAIRAIAGDEAGLAPTSMQRDIDTKLKGMSAADAAAYRAKAPNAVAYKYITAQMKKLGLDEGEE